jgi:hypothetical protein
VVCKRPTDSSKRCTSSPSSRTSSGGVVLRGGSRQKEGSGGILELRSGGLRPTGRTSRSPFIGGMFNSRRFIRPACLAPLWRVCATSSAAFLHNGPSPYCRKEPSKTLRTPFFVPCSWNNSLTIDDLDAQRSELQQLRNRGKVYDSAMLDAMDANEGHGENMLPRTEVFGIYTLPKLVDSSGGCK